MKAMRIAVALAMIALPGLVLSIQLSLLAQQQPVLQVSPASLSFEGEAGGSPPAPHLLTIANAGGGLLQWQASADAKWIVLGASEGTLSGGRAISLAVLVETEGLTAGAYEGTITIADPQAEGSPAVVDVTLTLTGRPPVLEVTPSELEFQGQEGGSNPAAQTLTIRNSGGQPLTWSAQENIPWLSLNRLGGALQPRQSVDVRVFVNLTGLQAGTRQGEITITASGAQNSPVTVPVTLILTPRPQPSEPITIGAILPLTGPLESFGPRFQIAAQLAVDEINRADGLLGGSQVQLEVRDSRTNPSSAAAAAQQLVNEVEVIFGAAASGVTIPISTVTIPSQVVLISPSATSPAITDLDDDDLVFRTAPPDAFQGHVLAELAVSQGYRRVAIIARNDAYGVGLANAFKQSFKSRGRTITNVVLYNPSTTNFSSQIASARVGDPDAISLITFDEGEQLITQMVAAGVTNFDLFVDGIKNQDLFDRVARSVGTARLEGKVGTAPVLASNAPGAAAFEAAYRARLGEDPWVFTPHSYDALALIALAIEKAGEYDGRAIRDALRFVANPPGEVVTVGELGKALEILRRGGDINYEGASGSVDFDANGDVPGLIGVWTLRDGKIVDQDTVYFCSSTSGTVQCRRQ